MGILATYRAYKEYEKPYENWQQRQNINDSKKQYLLKEKPVNAHDIELAQKKAGIVADSVLILDNYAQTKAEDVEAVFQTLQLELLAGLLAVSALPTEITEIIPTLEKHSQKSGFLKKTAEYLSKYDNVQFKIGAFKLPVKKLVTVVVAAVSSLIYIPTVIDAVKNQIGSTRRAKFEGMNLKLSNVNDFAILDKEQEVQVQSSVKDSLSKKKPCSGNNEFKEFCDEATERVDIGKSLQLVQTLLKDKDNYIQKKQKYDNSLLNNQKNFDTPLADDDIYTAKSDKHLFETMVKKVDLDSQEPLEKFEKVINVGYASLFIGGFLEHLLSKKLVEVMKIKNPILKPLISFGVPLVTYFVLNKNLACTQNNAIKAVRYKKVNEFLKNKDNFVNYSQDELDAIPDEAMKVDKPKKETLFQFLKSISEDIKEYKKYQREILPQKQEYLNAKRQIKLSKMQEDNAKLLQKNTFMTINKVDDKSQQYSESIEALSEIALAPVEILSTLAGAAIGDKISSVYAGSKYKGLFRGLGALVLFIPSALAEVWTTHQQRTALKIANMLAVKEIDDYRHFVDYDNKTFKQQIDSKFAFKSKTLPSPFIAFQQSQKNN